MSDIDHTDELLSELRRDGVRIETDVLRRRFAEMGVGFTADDSHEMLRTYFYDWEYDEDLYGKHGVYSDRTELSTVCLTAEEAVEIALNVWDENEKLRKKLEFEREDNASIRALFDAVAPRCGKPDCPSLVEYVEQLRELCKDMWRTAMANMDFADRYAFAGEFNERMRELGIEVDAWS